MKKLILFLLLLVSTNVFAQLSMFNSTTGIKDSIPPSSRTSFSTKKAGGIFFTPFIGLDYPIKEFNVNSKYGIAFGAKIEYGSLAIYPFVPYVFVQSQTNPGNDVYKTVNYLNSLDTKILSFGGGTYLLLNKYLKMNFTMPFLIAEFRYLTVKRNISPESPQLGLINESLIAPGVGLGFTLYIFDLSGTYYFAKNYSSVTAKVQFHFPIYKF